MSLNVKSNGTQKEVRLMPDITTPPFASEYGDSFNNNFTLIDLENRESLYNKPSYFAYSSEQLKSGNVINIPTGLDTNQPFLGYREVFPMHVGSTGGSHVMVKVTEFYPIPGREHYRFYNSNAWGSWRSVNGN